MNPVLVAVYLIILHSIDGREIGVNPAAVTKLTSQQADSQPNKVLTGEVRCVVSLADGKFVSVIESCATVKQILEAAK